MMHQQLTGKVAIVTGSSSGIGEAIAVLFASRGAKVTLCGRDADRLRTALDKVVKASGGHKDRFLAVPGDVSQATVRAEIVNKTVEKFGRLDILIPNHAIVLLESELSTATEESYDTLMNCNLKSVFFLIQQARPHLEKSKGCIIATSSIGGQIPVTQWYLHATSKAALDHLLRCLTLELGPKGIRVNAVSPGYVRTRIITRLTGESASDVSAAAIFERETAVTPLGRLGTGEDLAEAFAFLASDAASFITGQNIQVDGGRSLVGKVGE